MPEYYHDIIAQPTLLDLSEQLYYSWLTEAWNSEYQGRVKTFPKSDGFVSPQAGPQSLIWHPQVHVPFSVHHFTDFRNAVYCLCKVVSVHCGSIQGSTLQGDSEREKQVSYINTHVESRKMVRGRNGVTDLENETAHVFRVKHFLSNPVWLVSQVLLQSHRELKPIPSTKCSK